MKEKILGAVVIGFLEVAVLTASATAGSLFADCIKMKIQENLIRKEQKKTKRTD